MLSFPENTDRTSIMSISSPKTEQVFQPSNGQEFSGSDPVSASLGNLFLDHVEQKYAPLRFASEKLAQIGGVTPASARNWLRRMCAPQADQIGIMARNDPEFRAKLIKWLEQDG
jgi:hypothetical protein